MKDLLIEGARLMGVTLSEDQADRLSAYKDILLEWNGKMNLTAITDEKEIAVKHFLDSLSPIPTGYVRGRVIDVGTGAGFPGLVLKAALPDISLTLLDSLNKRISFLRAAAEKMELDGIDFVHSRAEDGGRSVLYREKFDTVVSRAVANMTLLSELTLPFLKQGGRLLALKGPLADEELSAAERAIHILGGKTEAVIQAHIPFSDLCHKIVIVKKVRPTPSRFPRKPALISKSPIDTPYNRGRNTR